jgi:DNA-binding transcriptional ArsR family regulator
MSFILCQIDKAWYDSSVSSRNPAPLDDTLIRAATSPRRRQILQLVWDDELSSRQIAAHFRDVTWQAVSLNLRVLRETGLVKERRDGTRRFYRADRKRCKALESLLKAMWAQDLQRLGSVIEQDRGK